MKIKVRAIIGDTWVPLIGRLQEGMEYEIEEGQFAEGIFERITDNAQSTTSDTITYDTEGI